MKKTIIGDKEAFVFSYYKDVYDDVVAKMNDAGAVNGNLTAKYNFNYLK